MLMLEVVEQKYIDNFGTPYLGNKKSHKSLIFFKFARKNPNFMTIIITKKIPSIPQHVLNAIFCDTSLF